MPKALPLVSRSGTFTGTSLRTPPDARITTAGQQALGAAVKGLGAAISGAASAQDAMADRDELFRANLEVKKTEERIASIHNDNPPTNDGQGHADNITKLVDEPIQALIDMRAKAQSPAAQRSLTAAIELMPLRASRIAARTQLTHERAFQKEALLGAAESDAQNIRRSGSIVEYQAAVRARLDMLKAMKVNDVEKLKLRNDIIPKLQKALNDGLLTRDPVAYPYVSGQRSVKELAAFVATRHVGVSIQLAQQQLLAESAGKPGAVSSKGALGLMQVKLSTAQDVLKSKDGRAIIDRFGLRGITSAKLKTRLTGQSASDQELNVTIGQTYMRQMLIRYNGDVPTALAAYNYGLGNVDKWLANGAVFQDLPKETRDYVTKLTKGLGVVGGIRSVTTIAPFKVNRKGQAVITGPAKGVGVETTDKMLRVARTTGINYQVTPHGGVRHAHKGDPTNHARGRAFDVVLDGDDEKNKQTIALWIYHAGLNAKPGRFPGVGVYPKGSTGFGTLHVDDNHKSVTAWFGHPNKGTDKAPEWFQEAVVLGKAMLAGKVPVPREVTPAAARDIESQGPPPMPPTNLLPPSIAPTPEQAAADAAVASSDPGPAVLDHEREPPTKPIHPVFNTIPSRLRRGSTTSARSAENRLTVEQKTAANRAKETTKRELADEVLRLKRGDPARLNQVDMERRISAAHGNKGEAEVIKARQVLREAKQFGVIASNLDRMSIADIRDLVLTLREGRDAFFNEAGPKTELANMTPVERETLADEVENELKDIIALREDDPVTAVRHFDEVVAARQQAERTKSAEDIATYIQTNLDAQASIGLTGSAAQPLPKAWIKQVQDRIQEAQDAIQEGRGRPKELLGQLLTDLRGTYGEFGDEVFKLAVRGLSKGKPTTATIGVMLSLFRDEIRETEKIRLNQMRSIQNFAEPLSPSDDPPLGPVDSPDLQAQRARESLDAIPAPDNSKKTRAEVKGKLKPISKIVPTEVIQELTKVDAGTAKRVIDNPSFKAMTKAYGDLKKKQVSKDSNPFETGLLSSALSAIANGMKAIIRALSSSDIRPQEGP